jgi:uncharacterized Fe-S radical SAM superfamily protein PflX
VVVVRRLGALAAVVETPMEEMAIRHLELPMDVEAAAPVAQYCMEATPTAPMA